MSNIPTYRTREKTNTALESALSDILQTREIRQLIITLVPQFLGVWAGPSKVKGLISNVTGFVVNRQLSKQDDVFDNDEIQALFTDKIFVKNLICLLPGLINTIVDALSNAVAGLENESFENESGDTLKEVFHTLLTQTARGKTGKFLTSLARMLSRIHKSDPTFFTKTLEPGIQKWIESVDFAEIKEAVDGSQNDALAFVEMVNSVIWQYPSKVIGIFSLLPSLANLVTGSLNITIEKLNAVPPDLLTDIITSLLNEINGEQVAVLLNELTEIARKLHVGSALIGEPGYPQLENALAAKIDTIVSQMDPKIFWRGKIALASFKSAVDDAIADAVGSNPEFLKLSMINGPELHNISLKSKNRYYAFLDSLGDEDFESMMNFKLSALDTEEAAELINGMVRNVNRMWELNPDICIEFARQFLNSIDQDELAFTVSRLFEEIKEDLKPVVRTFVPGLVQWVCEVIAPVEDEYEEQAGRARKALGSLLITEEV